MAAYSPTSSTTTGNPPRIVPPAAAASSPTVDTRRPRLQKRFQNTVTHTGEDKKEKRFFKKKKAYIAWEDDNETISYSSDLDEEANICLMADDDNVSQHVLPGHKIGENSLRQRGFINQGLSYIHPEDAIGEQASEDDDANIPMPDPTNVAGPSQIHEDYSLESLSRQIIEMARLQNTRHEEIFGCSVLCKYHNTLYLQRQGATVTAVSGGRRRNTIGSLLAVNLSRSFDQFL
ncbi:hypothetical protein LR48_Vigan03g152100 [Vigna angularis]|uniref:Uncharacterized protein n=1 Tax=Phaseolus angularis TaxID=3914 RepID=A0A0L9U6S2_PHAAN|nr:hypothetical protein LR48_Vigan03g152100 [Vigna angularis]